LSSPVSDNQAEGEPFAGLEKGAKAVLPSDKTVSNAELSKAQNLCSWEDGNLIPRASEAGVIHRGKAIENIRRGVSIESFASSASVTIEDPGEDGDNSGRCVEPPKASDGWHVQTYNVLQFRDDSNSEAAMERRMRTLAEKGSYTREQLQLLLGQLSDSPLSGSDELHTSNSISSKTSSKGSSKVPSDVDAQTTEGTQSAMSLLLDSEMCGSEALYTSEDDRNGDSLLGLETDSCEAAAREEAMKSKDVVLIGSFNSRILQRRRKGSMDDSETQSLGSPPTTSSSLQSFIPPLLAGVFT